MDKKINDLFEVVRKQKNEVDLAEKDAKKKWVTNCSIVMPHMQEPYNMTTAHVEFLNELRASGQTNMFGARDFLMDEFIDLKEKEATAILLYWMASKKAPVVSKKPEIVKPKM